MVELSVCFGVSHKVTIASKTPLPLRKRTRTERGMESVRRLNEEGFESIGPKEGTSAARQMADEARKHGGGVLPMKHGGDVARKQHLAMTAKDGEEDGLGALAWLAAGVVGVGVAAYGIWKCSQEERVENNGSEGK